MAREKRRAAKRANRPNPREDRNFPRFIIAGRYGETDDTIAAFERTHRHHRNQKYSREQTSLAPRKPVVLIPRNLSQETYIEALTNEEIAIVFAMGPAGTGKTMLGTQFAIKQLQQGSIDKVIITRPAVSVDEQHGFLPGDLTAKLLPWCIPIIDVFKEHYSVAAVERMLKEEIIEIAPLAYMRGRTLKNAIVIFDESQNATPNQMKMVLTRIGEGSRMIITGDLKQHDRGFEMNGLKDFIARLQASHSRFVRVCRFDTCDVERHPAVEEILRIYGED